MKEELKFLIESDEHILDAELVDIQTIDEKSLGLSITVGHSEKDILEKINVIEPNNNLPEFAAFEILLTKKDLTKIQKLLDKY
jgi:hypothetical protein